MIDIYLHGHIECVWDICGMQTIHIESMTT